MQVDEPPTVNLTDAALERGKIVATDISLERARQLDGDAWSQIYDQFYPRVYAFLLTRVRDGMLAEDLAADVFVNALRAINSYEERGLGLATWLFRIAQNRLTDHLRRSAARPSDSLDALEEHEQPSDSASAPSGDEHSARLDLHSALMRLSPEQRQIVHLRFVEGLTSLQVASILGKTEAAVKIAQHRALKALKQLMNPSSLTQ